MNVANIGVPRFFAREDIAVSGLAMAARFRDFIWAQLFLPLLDVFLSFLPVHLRPRED